MTAVGRCDPESVSSAASRGVQQQLPVTRHKCLLGLETVKLKFGAHMESILYFLIQEIQIVHAIRSIDEQNVNIILYRV